METSKLLIFAYIFPPTATTGVHRTTKIVKYLPKFGWEPTVITSAAPTYRKIDYSLLDDIPENTDIHRVYAIESDNLKQALHKFIRIFRIPEALYAMMSWRIDSFFRKRNFPDHHAPWAKRASEFSHRIISKKKFDAIYTTSWPYSTHMAGLETHEKTNIPWIADFRDPWLGNSNYKRNPKSKLGQLEADTERKIVEKANIILAPTETMIRDFQSRYSNIPQQKFRLVRNGYDPSNIPKSTVPDHSDTLLIGYVGAFYRERTPKIMLEAIQILRRQGYSPKDIKLIFVGNMGGTEKLIDELELNEFCTVKGQHPLNECYQLISPCQVLWLPNDDKDRIAVPGKTYEYLAMNRWILGSLDEKSECGRILAAAGEGISIVSHNDAYETATAISGLIQKHRNRTLQFKRKEFYEEQFSRENQTKILANILSEHLTAI